MIKMNNNLGKILIIGDELKQIQKLTFSLTKKGYCITTSDSFDFTINNNILNNFNIVIISEIFTPITSQFKILKEIKKFFPDIQVIVLEDYLMKTKGNIKKLQQENLSINYINEPVKYSKLFSVIRNSLMGKEIFQF